MENITSNVSIQDAKVLLDMNFITSEEFALFTKAKAEMVKNTVQQYNRNVYEQQFGNDEEEKDLSSHVIS